MVLKTLWWGEIAASQRLCFWELSHTYPVQATNARQMGSSKPIRWAHRKRLHPVWFSIPEKKH